MPALAISDEITDDVNKMYPLIAAAVSGTLTDKQRETLGTLFSAHMGRVNSHAAFLRLARAIERVGDTPHTRELACKVLRIET